MECCEECPEYNTCDDKSGCCDMCDLYNPKTKKCAYMKDKEYEEEIFSRKKLEEEDELETLDENEMDGFEDTYDDMNPYDEDDTEIFLIRE